VNQGDVVAGQYEIREIAGRGGMGVVYRARDRSTGDNIALKILHGSGKDASARFVREARAMAELSHPGIVHYLGHGETLTGDLFIAMEWLEGEALSDRLKGKGVTIEETLVLVRGVSEALAIAHKRGIVHRDLKPSNLLLVDGKVSQVKVLDFGIARLNDTSSRLTVTGAMVGTPGYMAPEQARGEANIDPRADVFALGCVLFKCITGEPVFSGEDMLAIMMKIVIEDAPRLRSVRSEIPRDLDDLVARMLSKRRDERPDDAAAVVEAIDALNPQDASTSVRRVATRPSLTATEQRVHCLVLSKLAELSPMSEDDATKIVQPAEMETADTQAFQARDAKLLALRMVVDRYRGRLDLLADGSVLSIVESAGAATDQAVRAAQCAIAMQGVLGGVPMAVVAGRGVVSGRSPMGEVIERGATLLAQSDGEIRIDEVTAGLLDGRFDVGGDRQGLVLKGARDAGDGARTLLGRPTPCVGRERELAALLGFFEEVSEEPMAHAVLVTALAGIGKSRLRYEFLRRLEEQESDAQLWISRGDPMSVGSPFGMIAQPIRRAAGLLEGEDTWVRIQKLRARVGRNVPAEDVARVSEFLGEICGVSFPDDESVELRTARRDPMLMGDQMRRAWEDFLTAECKVEPVILILEDLHWGDLPSVKMVDGALRLLHDQSLLVLALARPEVHDMFPKLWSERNLQEIRLGELTKKGSERLVRKVLGDKVTDETIQIVVKRAAGNAFYLEELIRAVAEGKGVELPQSVLAMIQSRLDDLEPEARRILRGASVLGQVFWFGAVVAMLGGEQRSHEVKNWLKVLVDREMVSKRSEGKFPGEEEFVFRHALMREAAYTMLTDEDRALGHRIAAEWLDGAGELDALRMAEHYERGEVSEKAAGWFARAASQALEGNDLEVALKLAGRGVANAAGDPYTLGPLERVRAEAHRWRGEFSEAEQSGLAAMSHLAKGSAAWHSAVTEVVLASGRLGHPEKIKDLFAQLREAEVDGEVNAAHVIACAQAAGTLLFSGKKELSAELFEHIDKVVGEEANLDPSVLASISRARGMRALFAGDPSGFLLHMERAAEGFERAGDLRSTCTQRVNVGFAHMELGSYEAATGPLRDALAAAERIGLFMVIVSAKHNLGLALARQGRVDVGIEVERAALQAAIAQGDRRIETACRTYLASMLASQDDLDGAEQEAEMALELSEASPPAKAYALATLADIRLRRSAVEGVDTAVELARSSEASQAAMTILDEMGAMEEGESLVRLIRAETLHASGDTQQAHQVIAEAKERLLTRADKIADADARDSFLTNVRVNRRTIQLALEWLDS